MCQLNEIEHDLVQRRGTIIRGVPRNYATTSDHDDERNAWGSLVSMFHRYSVLRTWTDSVHWFCCDGRRMFVWNRAPWKREPWNSGFDNDGPLCCSRLPAWAFGPADDFVLLRYERWRRSFSWSCCSGTVSVGKKHPGNHAACPRNSRRNYTSLPTGPYGWVLLTVDKSLSKRSADSACWIFHHSNADLFSNLACMTLNIARRCNYISSWRFQCWMHFYPSLLYKFLE